MAQQHPLFDTFRAAEELANQVDQHLARSGTAGDQGPAAGIREAIAFVMLHLVESFPRMGGRPEESLGKAREHLIRLQDHARALARQAGAAEADHPALTRSVDRVITKLAFTMSWLADRPADPPADGTRRRERIPVA